MVGGRQKRMQADFPMMLLRIDWFELLVNPTPGNPRFCRLSSSLVMNMFTTYPSTCRALLPQSRAPTDAHAKP